MAKRIASSSTIPTTIEELDGYDAVLLSDVARNSLNDQQMKIFATYIRDLGGGFSARGSFSGQWSKQSLLPSSEQFFLGGEGSVRARFDHADYRHGKFFR